MKKNVKKVASILVAISFVGLVGWNATLGSTNAKVTDVNLDNIEAIASECNCGSCRTRPDWSCCCNIYEKDGLGCPCGW